MPKTKISACIVTHNSMDKIGRTVRSILDNTKGVDLTLYISDNASADNTADFIEKEFPQVKVIRNEINGGFGWAHNKVLGLIDSEYHVIINPDIILNSDVITDLAVFLDKHPDVVMLTPKILNEDGSEQHLPKREPKLKYLIGGKLQKFGKVFKNLRAEYTMQNVEIKQPLDIDFCTGCFMFIRTDAFKQLNGFDDRFFMYLEDADLTRRAKQIGRVVFYPSMSVVHLWERASYKSFKFFMIHLQSIIKYYLKWFRKR